MRRRHLTLRVGAQLRVYVAEAKLGNGRYGLFAVPLWQSHCRRYASHAWPLVSSVGARTCARTAHDTLTPPDASFAYRYLLQHGHFTSLLELAHAPYAPGPLQVLQDCITYADVLHARVSAQGHHTTHAPDALPSEGAAGVGASLVCSGDEAVSSSSSSLAALSVCDVHAQMLQALSCEQDVRVLLERATDAVTQAVHAVDEVGDRQSIAELQLQRRRVTAFAQCLDAHRRGGCVRTSTASAAVGGATLSSSAAVDGDAVLLPAHGVAAVARGLCSSDAVAVMPSAVPAAASSAAAASLSWQLHDAVYAAMLRGLLAMTCTLGHYLAAVDVLDALLQLTSRCCASADARSNSSSSSGANSSDALVACDDAAAATMTTVPPVVAEEHVCAMQSCTRAAAFDVAAGLYRRLLHLAAAGAVPLSTSCATAALIALAQCCRHVSDWQALRDMLTRSEAAAVVPVSEPLYTALIAAVGRARGLSSPLPVAMALYRRLRDGGVDLALTSSAVNNKNNNNNSDGDSNFGSSSDEDTDKAVALRPSVHTYDALLSCCAAAAEPTRAFALYHEARAQYDMARFPASLYAHLLRAYSAAGYGADARTMLEVLAEAGASLTRTAFHAVLAGAVTLREAQEVLQMMLSRYHIPATPHTYAYLLAAAVRDATPSSLSSSTSTSLPKSAAGRRVRAQPARSRGGVQLLLQLYDIHEQALAALLALSGDTASADEADDKSNNSSRRTQQLARMRVLEHALRTCYPRYIRVLEQALLRVRVDYAHADAALLHKYVKPLVRVVQQRMNDLVGMPPQAPTRLPVPPAASRAHVVTTSCTTADAHATQQQQQQPLTPGSGTRPSPLCVAVLAADVLANVDVYVRPFVQYYSAIVVPYSALAALQHGRARRVDGAAGSHRHNDVDDDADGDEDVADRGRRDDVDDDVDAAAAAAMLDDADAATHPRADSGSGDDDRQWWGDAHVPMLRQRRRRLAQFLREHRDVVHVLSLEDELRASAALCRYGVTHASAFARCAGLTVHLARRSSLRQHNNNSSSGSGRENNEGADKTRNNDEDGNDDASGGGVGEGSDSVYARHAAHLVLVSTNYAACGRLVVKLKQYYCNSNNSSHHNGHTVKQQHRRDRRRRGGGDDGRRDGYLHRNTTTLATLRDALSRVHYHNPATEPNWTPPSLTIAALVTSRARHTDNDNNNNTNDDKDNKDSEEGCGRRRDVAYEAMATRRVTRECARTASSVAAAQMYRRALGTATHDAGSAHVTNDKASTTTTVRAVDMDASLLSAMMAE